MIRQVDSSLLDEWEKMRDPNYQRADAKEVRPPGAEAAEQDVTRDTKTFTASIRNRVFTFLRGLVIEDFEAALAVLFSQGRVTQTPEIDPAPQIQGRPQGTDPTDADGQSWTAERLKKALEPYYSDHQYISLDPNARNARHTYILPAEDKKTWRVQQMLVDPDEHNDWVAEFEVDLAESRKLGEPTLKLLRIASLT
jgi:hypothetical protein